jgi:hypothetical protein
VRSVKLHSVCLPTGTFQCYTAYWFSVTFRYIFLFTVSLVIGFFCLVIGFFCLVTLRTSISYFILGLSLPCLPSGDQVNIRLGHQSSPMHNSCLCYLNTIYYAFLTELFVFLPFLLQLFHISHLVF